MPASRDALDEARVLGDEAPAGPDGVGAGAPQRVEDAVVIEVGGDLPARRVQALDGVGVAHEGRVSIHVGVERDHPQLGALVRAQRLHGADAAHRGLAAVHDREPVDRLEHVHVASLPRPVSRAAARKRPWWESERSSASGAAPRESAARGRRSRSGARRARNRGAPPRRRGRARARLRRRVRARRRRAARAARAARRARGRPRRSRWREGRRPPPRAPRADDGLHGPRRTGGRPRGARRSAAARSTSPARASSGTCRRLPSRPEPPAQALGMRRARERRALVAA